MTSISIGDLAQSFAMRNRNAAIKQDINRFTQELTTGRTADMRAHLGANYAQLTDLERRSDVLKGFGIATAEAAQFSGGLQLALGRADSLTHSLAKTLKQAELHPQGVGLGNIAKEARTTLSGLIETLNGKTAGRYMLSGNATDTRPLVDAEEVLDAARAALAGATTPDEMMTRLNAWLDDPAGAVADIYRGSDTPLAGFSVSATESVAVEQTAADGALMRMIGTTAVAALATDSGFALSSEAQISLFTQTGVQLLSNQEGVIALQSHVGFAESRIETIMVRNEAEQTSISIARTTLLEIDTFEAATRLEEAQFQLQSLYAVTVKSSQLSLVNFL